MLTDAGRAGGVFLRVKHDPRLKGAGPQRPPNFWDLLYTQTIGEKKYRVDHIQAQGKNFVTEMLTHDLLAVANLLV